MERALLHSLCFSVLVDCSVFLLGHVLHRRGVRGPFRRVSFEDERYVLVTLLSRLISSVDSK